MKKLLVLLLVFVLAFGMVACASDETTTDTDTSNDTATTDTTNDAAEEDTTDTDAAESDGDWTVGFCPMDLSNNFWASIANSFKAAGDEAGVTTIVADGKSDAATQVSALENFISQQVDVIVVGPVDAASLAGVIAEAKEAGIPVITHTTYYEDATCNMNVDELAMGTALGQACGKWMAETFGEDTDAQFAILTQSALEQTIGRENGIKAGIAEYCPNAQFVTSIDAHTTDLGITAGEDILAAYPDIKAICGINDSGALGAYETCIAQDVGDEFFIGGVDGTEQALKLISEGTIYRCSVDLNPTGTGEQFIEYALALRDGEEIPESFMIPVNAVTAENIGDYVS